MLRNLDYTYNLSEETIRELTFGMGHLYVNSGRYLFKEGHEERRIYFILDGYIEIYMTVMGKEVFIDRLYPGCTMCGYSCISGEDISISAKTVSHVNLYTLDYEYIIDVAPFMFDLK